MLSKLKALLLSIVIVVAIGVCVALTYFFTIFGGVFLLLFGFYVLVREYNRKQ